MAENLLIVISGPSGVGKGTVVEKLLKDSSISESVSCTTREMRAGEVEGKHYFFISKEEFESRLKQGEFLEYSTHFDNYYGTPMAQAMETLKENDLVLEIDVNGALQVKESFDRAVLILIAPPTFNVLKKRLVGRNTETDEQMESRIVRAEYELCSYKKYDYIVVNNTIEQAVDEIKCIIRAEKLKSINQKDTVRKILEV